jgi:hypothetical protein
MKRKILLVISFVIFFMFSMATAKSPPYSKLTITGKTKKVFNKVSLFESGGSKKPFKTEKIFDSDGEYSITVHIPRDMKQKNNYMYTDMRFWNDKNNNGRRDKGEEISECHFVMWYPESDKLYLKVYKGPQYKVTSPTVV